MAKFLTTRELAKHRSLHSDNEESETEDDLFEEDEILSNKEMNSDKSGRQEGRKVHVDSAVNKRIETDTVSVNSPKVDLINKSCDNFVETPFKCETCEICFETSDDAKLHKSSNKCKFSCKLCKRKFNTLYAFVVHVMQHKVNIVKNQIPVQSAYLCTLCEKSFEDCFQLKRHEIITHKIKSSNPVGSSEEYLSKPTIEGPGQQINSEKNVEAPPKVYALQTTPELPANSNISDGVQEDTSPSQSIEISCDLCYDVFSSKEDLQHHMEFHKQLEKKSAPIVIDDDEDDEVVEVIENKKDPHEIITTIQKSSQHKRSQPSSPTNKYATLTPIYSSQVAIPVPSKSTEQVISVSAGNRNIRAFPFTTVTNPKVLVPKPLVPTAESNQKLTAKIKEMLIPNTGKKSKTILLTNNFEKMPPLKPVYKLRSCKVMQQAPSLGSTDNLELRKTGPTSYSFIYKDNTANTTNNQIDTATASNSGLTTAENTVSNTFSITTPIIHTSETAVATINTQHQNPPNIGSAPNYKFVMASAPASTSSSSSSAITNLIISTGPTSNIVSSFQNTPLSTILPNITANNKVANNSLTNFVTSPSVVQSTTIPSASTSTGVINTNFAYVIGTNTAPTFAQMSPNPSINFSDPSTKIAYVIIPHVNTNLSIVTPTKITSTSQSPGPALEQNTNDRSTLALPADKTLTVDQPEDLQESSQPSSAEAQNKSVDQLPLITSVISLPEQSTSNVPQTVSAEQSSKNLDENVFPLNTSSSNEIVSEKNESTSNLSKSRPDTNLITNEMPIVIDSDSSVGSNEDESGTKRTNDEKEDDSDSAEENLVIDEQDADRNNDTTNEGTDQRKGLIFVRNMTELMAPERDTTMVEADDSKSEKKSKESKEKKYTFPMKCDGCSVVFNRFRAMRNHNERRHKCLRCAFKCCRVSILREHYMLQHKLLYCARCSFLASGKHQFMDHNRVNHNCKTCNGTFANLSMHACPAARKDKEDDDKKVEGTTV